MSLSVRVVAISLTMLFVCGGRALAGQDLLFLQPNASAPAQIAIAFEEESVVTTSVTPRASVAFFVVSRRPMAYHSRFLTAAEIVDDQDSDGTVRFNPAEGVDDKDVWCAIDLNSGAHAFARRSGVVRVSRSMASRVRRGADGQITTLEHSEPIIELLWARPGVGAWVLTAVVGSESDDLPTRPHPPFTTAASKFKPMRGRGSPPPQFKKGDVIVGISPIHGAAFVTTLE